MRQAVSSPAAFTPSFTVVHPPLICAPPERRRVRSRRVSVVRARDGELVAQSQRGPRRATSSARRGSLIPTEFRRAYCDCGGAVVGGCGGGVSLGVGVTGGAGVGVTGAG